MRIIAGDKKGLKLTTIKGDFIRPTSDKIRGAIFSSLYGLVKSDYTFVDCFSGSGAMAIEALSRGAGKVYLFDNNRRSIEIIKKNLALAGYQNQVILKNVSAEKGLEILAENGVKADVIFMDPPYKKISLIYPLFDKIDQYHLLSTSGIIVIEQDKHDTIDKVIRNFEVFKEKTYGNTTIFYYKKR